MVAPPVSRAAFGSAVFPPEVARELVNAGLEGSPFFSALTRRETTAGSLAFPTADPDGWTWVAELGAIPDVDVQPGSSVVVPCKLAGNVFASNESINDATFDLIGGLTAAVRGGMGQTVDQGCLYGAAAPAPAGVYAGLANVSGATLREVAVNGAAEILGAGGQPDALFVTAAMWAAEMGRETPNGPVYNGTDLTILGLRVIVVPTLVVGNAIVADTSKCYGVLRSDYRVDVADQTSRAWQQDGRELRIIARLAAVIPVPEQGARSLTITTP